MGGKALRSQAVAVTLVAALLAPLAFAPAASAGAVFAFVEGPSVDLQAGNPSSLATITMPNPSRAVNASLDISTISNQRRIPVPAATEGRINEYSSCPSLIEVPDAVPATSGTLSAIDLSRVATLDQQNWTQNNSVGGCPLLTLTFDVTAALEPSGEPPLFAQFTVAADLDSVAGQQNFTLAAWEDPPVGPSAWIEVPLSPQAPGQFTGTLYHPPVIGFSPPTLSVLLFAPGGGSFLTVDQVAVDFWQPEAPGNPDVFVASTGEPIWQFRSPSGLDASFGRTRTEVSGSAAFGFSSNGTAIQGFTGPLFVPAGSQINQAFFEALSQPWGDFRANDSGPTNYTVQPMSANTMPGAPLVGGFPIEARPTLAGVTLFGLDEHGVADALQTTASTSYTVGNSTTFEGSAAQTFLVEKDGAIERVELLLADATGHPVGPLVLQIFANVSGVPGSTVLGTGSVDATAARPGGWVNFTFSPPVSAPAGTSLVLVLSSPGSSAAETWDWRGRNGVLTDPYSNGTALVSAAANGSGPWVPQVNVDLAFRIFLTKPFNESLAPFIQVAGASGPATRMPNYNGSLTGWYFRIPGMAISVDPDLSGGGQWAIAVTNGLGVAVSFRWDATLFFELNPRTVEFAIGNRSAFITLPELDLPRLVDFGPALAGALAGGEYQEIVAGGQRWWLFEVRVRADGPAAMQLRAFDILYDATQTASGFQAALNTVAAAAPPGPSLSIALNLRTFGSGGSVRVSNPLVLYSQPPFYPPTVPTLTVAEGAVNATLLDLRQWFIDDGGPFALNFSINSVLPAVATAAVFSTPLDANLTLTMTDPEFSGSVVLDVRATDQEGLNVSRLFTVSVVNVNDAPQILPITDIVLSLTTGSFDLAPFLRDNDTATSALTISVSSVFATVNGTTLNFDYREAPSALLTETPTLSVSDGTTSVSATFRVSLNNAGRPVLSLPGLQSLIVGHAASFDLTALATDDRDAAPSLDWGVLRAHGVGVTPGEASASVAGHTLTVLPTLQGDVDVNMSVRDRDGNVAIGVLHFHVVANQPPSLAGLQGTTWSVDASGELRINLSEYLTDNDDALANFTFNRAWTNGSTATVTVEGGFLVIRRLEGAGGSIHVTLTAADPANATTTAEFDVNLAGAGGAPLGLFLPLLLFVVFGVAGLLYISYRRGREKRPTLDKFQREDADLQEDEDGDRPIKRLKSPQGLERTDEERMLDDLDVMDKAATAPRIELPPATIIGFAVKPAASSVMLFYRDGRPISWVTTSSPTRADTKKAQEVAAALAARAAKSAPGDRLEWDSIEAGGVKLAVEGRAQLVLGAVLEPGADEAVVRLTMRTSMDRIFDANAAALKRWDGSRTELKRVDDILEAVFQSDPNRR